MNALCRGANLARAEAALATAKAVNEQDACLRELAFKYGFSPNVAGFELNSADCSLTLPTDSAPLDEPQRPTPAPTEGTAT